MKLLVSDSSNLFFIPEAYDDSHYSAKTLAGRLRGLLVSCKQASVLEALVEFPGPYLIEGMLQTLQSKIIEGAGNAGGESILSICWENDKSKDQITAGAPGSLGKNLNSLSDIRYIDEDSDAFESPSSVRRECNDTSSSRIERADFRNYRYVNDSSSLINSFSKEGGASLAYPHAGRDRNYKSVSDLGYGGLERVRMGDDFPTFSNAFEIPVDSDRDDASDAFSITAIHSPTSGTTTPRNHSFQEFVRKGIVGRKDATSDEMYNKYRYNIPVFPPTDMSCMDEITDQNKETMVKMCNLLRRMLMFVVEASNHELTIKKLFDCAILESIQLLEGIASEATHMKKSIKDLLKGLTNAYMESLKEHERAVMKFVKLEKALEGAFLGRWNNGGERSAPDSNMDCKLRSCHSNEESYKQNRLGRWNVVKDLLSNQKEFILYTNYVEQLCISGYLHDNLIKNRGKFTKDLTGVLKTFTEHYPLSIFASETEFLTKICSVSSTLLKGSYNRIQSMDLCSTASISFPDEGVMNLRFSVNVRPVALTERLHATIVECFEAIRSIAKKLSRLHLSQADRFARFTSRSPCMFCDVDLNVLVRAYKKYHKHLHSIWWSIASTINMVFPKLPSTLRRFKDLQQPVLGEFREVKLPLNLFNTVLRQFEAVIKISTEHSFNVCTASLKLCSERQSWSEFLTVLAAKHRIDHFQLQKVIIEMQNNAAMNKRIGIPFPSEGNDTAAADGSIKEIDTEVSIDIKEPVNTCEISKVLKKMLYTTEGMAEALVDYSECGYNFSFKKGDTIHVCIIGNTPLWLGHTEMGVDRWFPAKFVKLKNDCGMPLFRVADLQCDTYLDGYRISEKDSSQQTNKQDRVISLSSKALLKQSLLLQKLGLQGKLEYEFKCSICRKIVLRGTLYLTKSHLGFISSFNDVTLFGNDTTLTIPMKDIVSCELSSGKKLSFYVKITLLSGEVHLLHSVTNARRIRDAISELAQLEDCESQEIVRANSMDDTVGMESLKEFFGVIEPLSKVVPSISLHVGLEKFFMKNLSDNIKPGCRIADSRLSQNAMDFSGNLEPVEFDWNRGGIQFQKRLITYSFTLKEGKFTSLIPRQTCGKAREEIKYALVNRNQIVYESTTYVSDIPYAKYFYTILRLTATMQSATRTALKAEYDVKFLKSTMFSSVITAEACDRLLNSVHIITAGSGTTELPDPLVAKEQPMPLENTPSDRLGSFACFSFNLRAIKRQVGLRSLIWICIIIFVACRNLISNLD